MVCRLPPRNGCCRWPARWLVLALTLASGCGGELGVVGGPGSVAPSGQRQVDTFEARVPPDAVRSTFSTGGPRILFLNFDGATIIHGDYSDAAQNLSSIGSGGTIPPFEGPRQQVLDGVRALYSRYGVTVVDHRPPAGDYSMVVVGGQRSDIGYDGSSASVGVAPVDCSGTLRRLVGFAFADQDWYPSLRALDSARYASEIARVVSHEAGHIFSLLHTADGCDLMSYSTCPVAQRFLDREMALQDDTMGWCGGRTTQNSHARLLQVLGTALDATIVGLAATASGDGYWLATANGRVYARGDAVHYGDMSGTALYGPVVGISPTHTRRGYWLVGQDGGIFSFGDAKFYGSTGGMQLNAPVVGMAAHPAGKGYWFVASDGGIFTYGDGIGYFGSMGGTPLNAPVINMTATPSGNGYWLVAQDGGIFAFGDAPFFGSTGSMTLNEPVFGMISHPQGAGYWLVARDGGVFTFGNIGFYGSAGGEDLGSPIVAMDAHPSGKGYWMVTRNGQVRAYGAAKVFAAPTAGAAAPAP